MQFVVKGSKRDWIGATGWLTAAGRNGLRALGPGEQAQVFTSRDEAARAIDMLPPHFVAGGICFSVEAVGEDAQLSCREFAWRTPWNSRRIRADGSLFVAGK
jgi:hypothetical protein